MIHQPFDFNAFELVRVATLRAAQLKRGCSPRVPASHRFILTAQLEIASGKVHAEARAEAARPMFSVDRDIEPLLRRANQRDLRARGE